MAEPIDIELQLTKAPKPNTIEVEDRQEKKIRRMTPVVLVAIGVALLVVVLGASMWMMTNGFGINLNFAQTRGVLVPDIIPEPHEEKDPNGSNIPMPQSMCGPHEEGCTYNNPSDKDPEPSDPGSSDKGASPDGSSCEMFEEDCPYNNPSDTKQPEEPNQPEEPKQPDVTEKETVLMEPLSNKTLTSLLMKWLNETHGVTVFFRWRNESAALPDDDQPNWGRAVNALFVMADLYSPSSTDSTWSLEEKRAYLHWAKWVVKFSPETPEWLLWNPDYRIQLEKIKTELHHLQLQNLDEGPEPEGGEVSLTTGKPTTTSVTAEKFKESVAKEEESKYANNPPLWSGR